MLLHGCQDPLPPDTNAIGQQGRGDPAILPTLMMTAAMTQYDGLIAFSLN